MRSLFFLPFLQLLPMALLVGVQADVHAQRIMEKLNRGLIAVPVSGGHYLSWRLFGTEPYDMGFNVYKGATKLNATPITGATLYSDNSGGTGTYTVKPVIQGQEGEASEAALVYKNANYWSIPTKAPANGTFHGESFSYSSGDASTADLDGDGQYDLVLKWEPSNSKDNAQDGYTGPTLLEGLKIDGTSLWKINLGQNIRSGAHYTQFMVYDLDGDGRAEVAVKTAPGTRDGTGEYIKTGPAATASHATDYTDNAGRPLSGPEFFTVFDGLTGKELATVNYTPGRGNVGEWGGVGGNGGNDSKGNRVDRMLAAVAYLDGRRPSAVMCRGYYGRSTLSAWDWREGKLTQRWLFDSQNSTNAYSGQGAHSLSVADVDADGKDEIIYGAMTVDDNGVGLYTTKLRHGDALHVSDLVPSRPGLEVFMIHENEDDATSSPGSAMHDAKTGEILWQTTVGADVGRGVSADIDSTHPGAESWGAGNLLDYAGKNIGATPGSTNFLAWWDGDLLRELLNSNTISKHGGATLLTASGSTANNGTKSTPTLSADLFGDWREEVIWRTTNNSELRVYTTTIPTVHRQYTLMHNPAYRMAIAWQNVAYNQPPHVDFYLGTGMAFPPPKPNMALDATPILNRERVLPRSLRGTVTRFDGGRSLPLPLGYAGNNQIITVRDSFGKKVGRAKPSQGSLVFKAAIPPGLYFLQSETQD